MQGRFWVNDPDFLVVRGPGLARKPTHAYRYPNPYKFGGWETGEEFDLEEARTWASAVMLSGGAVTPGDRMSLLEPRALRLIKTVLDNLSNVPARPLDFWTSYMPALWLQRNNEEIKLGVFNWYDKPKTFTVTDKDVAIPELSGARYRELWTGKPRGTWNGELTLTIPPHAARVLKFAPLPARK